MYMTYPWASHIALSLGEFKGGRFEAPRPRRVDAFPKKCIVVMHYDAIHVNP